MKNKKRIMMIGLLIIFIAAIVVAVIMINNKSVEKISETSQDINTTTASTSVTNSEGTIRKSTEKAEIDTNNMVEITDNYFIEQTNDVYMNLNDYLGKTIKMQGLIYSYEDGNGDICYAVVRNTPGCCGNDGLAGLDIRYDGEYPEEGTWVEIVGVIGKDTVFNTDTPAIQIASITETEEGTTFVTN